MAAVTQAPTFGDIHLEGQGNQLVINQILQIAVAEIKQRPFVASSPYVGLSHFEERHKDFFFGRDALIAKLLGLVAAKNLVLVTGASGSGKSSLLHSGLLPQLSSRLPLGRFRPLILTPDTEPFVSLRGALHAAKLNHSDTSEVRSDAETPLAQVLHRLRPSKDLWLLFVDQFEELFTRCSDDRKRTRFIEALVALGSVEASEIRVVLAMRADFFDHLGAHPELISLAESALHMVGDMQASELRAAIEQPAARHGVVFEEGLVEQIIADVKGRPGALPLLQYTLDLLWQEGNPEGDRTLNRVNYHKLGGIEGALRLRADAIFGFSNKNKDQQQPRPESEKESMRRIFLRVVDLTSLLSADARAVSKRTQRSEFEKEEEKQIIAELVDEKLLVSDAAVVKEKSGSATVELAHEALLSAWPRLQLWLEQAREVLYVRNRLAADARMWSEVKAKAPSEADEELWGGSRLGQAQELRAGGDFHTVLGGLRAEEEAFLDASLSLRDRRAQKDADQFRREREAEERLAEEMRQKENQKLEAAQTLARRTRRATGVLGAMLLVVGAAGVQAYLKSAEARDGLLISMAQTLKDDPTAAATLLREVGYRKSNPWIQSASEVLQLAIAQTVLRGHERSVESVAFSPDGGRIVTGSYDRTARIWSADGSSAPVVLNNHYTSADAVAFSPDGKNVITGSRNGTTCIFNADGSGGKVLFSGDVSRTRVWAVALSPGGKQIVTGRNDRTAHIRNTDGSGTPVILEGHEDVVSAVAFSPDGKKVVTGSGDKTARIFNADGSDTPVVFKGHEEDIRAVAFSPDGKRVVTGSSDKTARIFNADGSGTPIVLKGHEGAIDSVAFSPDGKKVVTSSHDRISRIFTARIFTADGSGTPVVLKGHEGAIDSVAFSPDGKNIVTGSMDKTVRIFSSDGNKIVAFSPDHSSRMWLEPDMLLESLWIATTDCMPEDRRRELLLESPADAKQGHARCQREVARRRGWPAP